MAEARVPEEEQDGPASEKEPIELAPSLTWATVLGFPAATAILVGVVYVVGAFSRLEELNHAGVPTSTAFPLIPISQHLGRGLQVLLNPFVVLVVAVLLVLVRFLEAPSAREPRGTKRRPRLAIVALAAILLLLLVLAPLALLGFLIAGAVVIAVIAVASPPGVRTDVLRGRRIMKLSAPVLFIMFVLSLSAAVVFAEVVSPAPLPNVTLRLDGGRAPVTGGLIVHADGQWYVALPEGRILAVDDQTVASAVASEPHRARAFNETLFQLLGC